MAEEEVKGTTIMSKEEVIVVDDSAAAAKVPVAEAEEEDEVTSVTKNVVDENAADVRDKKPAEEEVVSKGIIPPKVVDQTHNNNNVENKGGSGELLDHEVKALVELKQLIQNALNNHEFSSAAAPLPPPPAVAEAEAKEVVVPEEKVEVTQTDEANVAKVEVETKKVSVDEDGTKTVEAIEETVVSVVSSMDEQQQQQTPDDNKESVVVVAAEAKEEAVTTGGDLEDTASSSLPEEVSIWGVPLMKDERTDTILWKFLRARDFKAKDAFAMIKSTIKWREEFGIEGLLEQDLSDEVAAEKVAFMHGFSKDGHPVCYNVYGAFQDKELYLQTFSDEVKREKFLKWRIQFLEKSIRKLDFSPGGINTIVQVNDLKNSPGPGKWELRQATKQALQLFQDNYPEFVAKQVFINVPWWYVAVNKMISPFLTQRTKSKFVVAGPSKSAETLFNYVAPEQVPIQYGGLSKTGDIGTKDGVTQIIVKPTSKESVEFAVTEACHLMWEVRVLGWDVSYGAEFVPNAKEGYTTIIQKLRKVGPSEETIITNSFKSSEPGKVVLTIDNSSSKKKRLLYRLKPITSSD